jgi:hypothetical protein
MALVEEIELGSSDGYREVVVIQAANAFSGSSRPDGSGKAVPPGFITLERVYSRNA